MCPECQTRGVEVNNPGDLSYYRRMKEPADRAANTIVDKARMRIGRFYGPGRVLASETKVEQQSMPWTLSALTRLLDKGEFDDETTPSAGDRKRGRSRTPGRAMSTERTPRVELPEPPVPPPREIESQTEESEPELMPVPQPEV